MIEPKPIWLLQASRLAGALAALGVTKGDRVLIYMPLIPETIIAMLATVRLGAVHSVVFGGTKCFERLGPQRSDRNRSRKLLSKVLRLGNSGRGLSTPNPK